MGKMDEESMRNQQEGENKDKDTDADGPHGHVTSISILRSYRRLGLAQKLMRLSRECTVLLQSKQDREGRDVGQRINTLKRCRRISNPVFPLDPNKIRRAS